MAKAGRPKKWTEDKKGPVVQDVCAAICGGETVYSYLLKANRFHYPRPEEFYRWMRADIGIAQAVEQAQEFGYSAAMDEFEKKFSELEAAGDMKALSHWASAKEKQIKTKFWKRFAAQKIELTGNMQVETVSSDKLAAQIIDLAPTLIAGNTGQSDESDDPLLIEDDD